MTPDDIRREMRELRITPDDLASVSDLSAKQIRDFLETDDRRDVFLKEVDRLRQQGLSDEEAIGRWPYKEKRKLAILKARQVEEALDSYLEGVRKIHRSRLEPRLGGGESP